VLTKRCLPKETKSGQSNGSLAALTINPHAHIKPHPHVSLRRAPNGVYAELPLLDDLTAQTLVVGPQRIIALPMKCALK
jgi:hypothetical protein